MSKKNCIYIPDELYGEILQISENNRNLTTGLWGLASNPAIQKTLGLEKGFTADEFLEKLGQVRDLNKILDTTTLVNHLNEHEGLDTKIFSSFDLASEAVKELSRKYQSMSPLIQDAENGFSVKLFAKTGDTEKQRFTLQQLGTLNRNLLGYINKLGFDVAEVDGLEKPGMFSPSDAITNANGLKEAIRVSKGISGQQIIPEEISHLLVEGFQNNPFMQRLMNQMTDNVVIDILGDRYDEYKQLYKNDNDKLKKEAVGRLVAQHLVDRNGIGDSIRFISDKMLNKMRDNLKNGSEREIDEFLAEMDQNVKLFVERTLGVQDIEMFDIDAVNEMKGSMYHVEEKISSLKELTEKAYNIMAKRVKIKQINSFDKSETKQDLIEFRVMHQALEKQEYTNACVGFLDYVKDDCQSVLNQLTIEKEKNRDGILNGLPGLKNVFRILNRADTIVLAYDRTISEFSTISLHDDIATELDSQFIDDIQDVAKEIKDIIDGIKDLHKQMLFSSMAVLYKNYWGENKQVTLNGKQLVLTLEQILEENVGDTNTFSRLVNSLADSQDPLLLMVDMLMKDAQGKRNRLTFYLQQQLGTILDEYVRDTGSRDMSFCFEMDENGKPSGMLKSDRDYASFHKKRNEYILKIREAGIKGADMTRMIRAWDNENMESVNVSPNDASIKRMERMPKLSLYGKDPHEGMTESQKKLYDKLIDIKKRLDFLLPQGRTHLYRAPMKKIEIKDQLIQGRSVKAVLKRIKDKYVKDVGNDVDYGEDEKIDQYRNGQHVILDFSGKEVKKIPMYYTTWLEDMSTLDTNLVDTLLSYGAMAINYHTMNEISDFMEATNSLMQDRRIVQTSNMKKLFERFKPTDDIAVQGDYIIEGRYSENAKKLRNYIDSNLYGVRKKREILRIGKYELDIGKIGDNFKNYNSLVSLGYNLFSGTTNLTMGMAQTFFEAASNSMAGAGPFKLRDVVKANGIYMKNLPAVIAQQYDDKRSNKLALLIEKLDCMEDYYQQLNDSNYYAGIFKKMVGKHNMLILNSMGEHYLHTMSMLAVLNNTKVKIGEDGELMSLYDALQAKEKEIVGVGGKEKFYNIEIPEGLLKENGESFTEGDLQLIKLLVLQVNQGMHGAFNETDRGDINRTIMGRLVMQFRQWMPAFYMKRFREERVNALTGQTEEGFYRTYYKFMAGSIKDLLTLKRGFLTRYKMLSETEKSNVCKGFLESASALLLMALLGGRLGDIDKDDPGLVNLIKYNMYRLKMELGSASPISYGFIDNVTTLIKSPIPAMENFDRMLNLFDFTAMFQTVESGKYAGWNKYLRNVYYSTPAIKNVGRFIDLAIDGDISIFNPYTKN